MSYPWNKKVKRLKTERSMTITPIARAMGRSENSARNSMNKGTKINVAAGFALAKLFDVSMDWLFDPSRDDWPPPPPQGHVGQMIRASDPTDRSRLLRLIGESFLTVAESTNESASPK